MKYQTCMVLSRVPMARVVDEAFWGMVWYCAMPFDPKKVRVTPEAYLYEVLLPFLTGCPLDEAMRDDGEYISLPVFVAFVRTFIIRNNDHHIPYM